MISVNYKLEKYIGTFIEIEILYEKKNQNRCEFSFFDIMVIEIDEFRLDHYMDSY